MSRHPERQDLVGLVIRARDSLLKLLDRHLESDDETILPREISNKIKDDERKLTCFTSLTRTRTQLTRLKYQFSVSTSRFPSRVAEENLNERARRAVASSFIHAAVS